MVCRNRIVASPLRTLGARLGTDLGARWGRQGVSGQEISGKCVRGQGVANANRAVRPQMRCFRAKAFASLGAAVSPRAGFAQRLDFSAGKKVFFITGTAPKVS